MSEKGNVVIVIIVVLLLTAIVGGAAYLLGSGKLSVSLNMGSPTATTQVETQAPVLTPTNVPVFTQEPMSGWKTYSDKGGKYSFKYPPEMSLKEYEDGTVSVYLWGPTQKEGTEFYDGINLGFKKGELAGKTLKAFVDKKVSELSGVFQVSSVSTVTVSGVNAYKFHVKGYVDGDYYYLALSGGSYLEIIDSTKDPTNKGFTQTASQVLATLKIK